MQHLQKTGGGGPHLAHPKRMPVLSPPTAEEPTHGSDHVGKDSSPVPLLARSAHPIRMRILSDHRESKDSSPASFLARSFHSLHQECFTTLLHPSASALFLKTAGVSPYNSQSGNCSLDTAPKGHFFRPYLSTACALFQVP